jgi:Flp pilus assembly protein TadG
MNERASRWSSMAAQRISLRAGERLQRIRKEERGQVLPMVAILMVGFLGMCGIVIDTGRVYVGYRVLQSATDAAALAGAQSLPSNSAPTAATTYSAKKGNLNANSGFANVTITTSLGCLSALTAQGIACVAPANANAIQVKETATVDMYFARIFGTSTVSMTATSTASMRGAITTPYNVAIILDATGSMSSTDSGDCNASRMTCELQGVRTLLNDLSPCAASQTTCGTATNGAVSNTVDNVSLFAFPNMTTATVGKEYDCSSSNPTSEPYTYPSPTANSMSTMPYTSGSTTFQMTYQILGFQSDYRTSDTASSLNSSSNTVKAVGGKSGCSAMSNPGGEGTYYAGALYAAQSALLAQQTANPGSQNVIILLSDGDASACYKGNITGSNGKTTSVNTCGSGSNQMSPTGFPDPTTGNAVPITNAGSYPSYVNECQQAVTAAAAIAATGTRVYSVAYGAAATSGCSTDTGTYKNAPCNAMKAIASSPAYFFSDYTASQNSGQCISASQPTTSLNQIFTQIAGSFTAARLIPDSMFTATQ